MAKIQHREVRPGYMEITLDGRTVQRRVIDCYCGEEVLCSHFTNTCSCGRDYNMSGQLLANRSQWGEETGEHPADIARYTGYEEF